MMTNPLKDGIASVADSMAARLFDADDLQAARSSIKKTKFYNVRPQRSNVQEAAAVFKELEISLWNFKS